MFSPLLFEGTHMMTFLSLLSWCWSCQKGIQYTWICTIILVLSFPLVSPSVTDLHHSSRRACLGLHRCGRLCLWNLQSSDSCHSLECHHCTGRKTRKKPKWLKLREMPRYWYPSKALWYTVTNKTLKSGGSNTRSPTARAVPNSHDLIHTKYVPFSLDLLIPPMWAYPLWKTRFTSFKKFISLMKIF